MRKVWALGIAVGLAQLSPASATTPAASQEEIAAGHQVFETWCEACHGPGADRPGTLGLQAKYRGQIPALLEKRTDLTGAFVKLYVRKGFAMMAPFRKTEISDAQLNDLCAYLTRPR